MVDFKNNKNISLTNSKNVKKNHYLSKMDRCCCTPFLFIIGIVLFSIGLFTAYYPIYDLYMLGKIQMTPGLPSYNLWLKPDPMVLLSVYIFTINNSKEFLSGEDTKLKLNEIGPIIYKEILEHTDIEFHENSTLTYTSHRSVEFLPNANQPNILNKTILIPNMAILATAAFMNDDYFIKKLFFNSIYTQTKDNVFINITIYDFLWNYKSVLLTKIKEFVPFLIPTDNTGILYNIYKNFSDRYNVRIGEKYGFNQFFLINTINNRTTLTTKREHKCDISIVDSTEGVYYPQYMTHNSIILFWRKTICRVLPLHFDNEVTIGSFNAYKFTLPENVYDRLENVTADCFKGNSNNILPNGISDVSKCYYDLPFAASNPHFYSRCENNISKRLEGLNPSMEKHSSYIILEPQLGIPMNQCARSQNNLVIPNLYGFHEEFLKFNDMILPLFWIEYHQKELTDTISALLYFAVNVLPILQYFITIALILYGGKLIYSSSKSFCYQKKCDAIEKKLNENLQPIFSYADKICTKK